MATEYVYLVQTDHGAPQEIRLPVRARGPQTVLLAESCLLLMFKRRFAADDPRLQPTPLAAWQAYVEAQRAAVREAEARVQTLRQCLAQAEEVWTRLQETETSSLDCVDDPLTSMPRFAVLTRAGGTHGKNARGEDTEK